MNRETVQFGKYVEFDHRPSAQEVEAAAEALWGSLAYARKRVSHIESCALIIKNRGETFHNNPLGLVEPPPGWTVGMRMDALLENDEDVIYIDGLLLDDMRVEKITVPPQETKGGAE